ncbi:hypothetical protein [Bradyrhizobium ganzhouense]|uniref:hypothetical protein n=1 Tax=Bradyrhizobium ganzhouense TaxID=1179767 RepID=UPI003CEE5A1D
MIAEERSNNAGLQMRANHERDWDLFMQEDGDVLTPGWLCPLGDLWWNHVTSKITLDAPPLLPEDQRTFAIKGVSHCQSNQGGTSTTVELCRSDGFRSGVGETIVFSKP